MNVTNRLITILSKVKKWKATKPEDLKFKAELNRDVFHLICDLIDKEAKEEE